MKPVLTAPATAAALVFAAGNAAAQTAPGEAPFPGTQLAGDLSGAAVAPGPGDPEGAGKFSLWADDEAQRLCYVLGVANVDDVTAAHIHRGTAGQAGPVAAALDLPRPLGTEACVASEAELIDEILAAPESFYIQVHSAQHPAGAIRAQLRPGAPEFSPGG
jgi:hypothetical protein